MSWPDMTCVAQVWEPSGWHWHVCGREAKNDPVDAFPLCGIHIAVRSRRGLTCIASNGVPTMWGKGKCVPLLPVESSDDTTGTDA